MDASENQQRHKIKISKNYIHIPFRCNVLAANETSSWNCDGGFLLNSRIIACTTRPKSLCTVN